MHGSPLPLPFQFHLSLPRWSPPFPFILHDCIGERKDFWSTRLGSLDFLSKVLWLLRSSLIWFHRMPMAIIWCVEIVVLLGIDHRNEVKLLLSKNYSWICLRCLPYTFSEIIVTWKSTSFVLSTSGGKNKCSEPIIETMWQHQWIQPCGEAMSKN